MALLSPFHLAIPVDNISVCRKFYVEILGCEEGRSSDHWVDFDLFGHQLVIHYKEKTKDEIHINLVDGKNIPIPHFGVVLEWNIFHKFSMKIHEFTRFPKFPWQIRDGSHPSTTHHPKLCAGLLSLQFSSTPVSKTERTVSPVRATIGECSRGNHPCP